MQLLACPFEKVILSTQCQCRNASRYYLAERVGVGCRTPGAPPRCAELVQLLRNNAQFALKVRGNPESLPYGKEFKLKCGGLLGLQGVLYPARATSHKVEDINDLVERAIAEFDSLDNLPYQQIVRAITAYQTRRRGNRIPR